MKTYTVATSSGIRLGQVVEDVVSGFKGVVYGLCYNLSGTWHLVLRPMTMKDEEPASTVYLEEGQVKFVEIHKDLMEPEFVSSFPNLGVHDSVAVGAEVTINNSGEKGQIRLVSFWLHGCTRFSVRLPIREALTGKQIETDYDPSEITISPAPMVTPKRKTGGPSRQPQPR